MQYWKYNINQYQYRTDTNLLKVRFGQSAAGLYVEDAELVVGGFLLAENVGWENIGGNLSVAFSKVREGVRSGFYVVDNDIDATGFNGTEGVNWQNINGAY